MNFFDYHYELTKGRMYIRDKHLQKDVINFVYDIISKDYLTQRNVEDLGYVIQILNICYNNSDLEEHEQLVEDGVYDLLLEKYKQYNPDSFQVGAQIVHIEPKNHNIIVNKDATPLFMVVDKTIDELAPVYYKGLNNNYEYTSKDVKESLFRIAYESGKKYRENEHTNIDLVGSLDKCKFVLNSEVIKKDPKMISDPKIKILERDFFGIHLMNEIINNNQRFGMVAELKYDGVSAVGRIKNSIIQKAEARGDVNSGVTTDFTPILYGYRFPNLPNNIVLDCKFEVCMSYYNLNRFNEDTGKSYKNCRSAVVGIMSSNDGYKYQKYLTLIPLAIAPCEETGELPAMNRVEEIEFINKYLASGERLRYSYIEDTYEMMLYSIKMFVEEAEKCRDILPFMYDGVVVSYTDQHIINTLGRVNFINKYSMAIKFNALKKLTKVTNITYTVGQNGTITPMIHYRPIEFIGTIHTKSSLSSYDRFTNLGGVAKDDIVEVEYINDVIPYVNRVVDKSGESNFVFTKTCPSCGGTLSESESGLTRICKNFYCPSITIQRMTNMFSKLGIVDIAEATVEKIIDSIKLINHPYKNKDINISISEILDFVYDTDVEKYIGVANTRNLRTQLDKLVTKPLYDYQWMGALGFTDIALGTWKKILAEFTISDIMYYIDYGDTTKLVNMLIAIKGIGLSTAYTISNEFEYFSHSINTILKIFKPLDSKGLGKRVKIRMTGFRDKEYATLIESKYNVDMSDGSVTKDTNILLVPSLDHESSKVTQAIKNGTEVVSIHSFRESPEFYINKHMNMD